MSDRPDLNRVDTARAHEGEGDGRRVPGALDVARRLRRRTERQRRALHRWLFSGDTASRHGGMSMAAARRDVVDDYFDRAGACVASARRSSFRAASLGRPDAVSDAVLHRLPRRPRRDGQPGCAVHVRHRWCGSVIAQVRAVTGGGATRQRVAGARPQRRRRGTGRRHAPALPDQALCHAVHCRTHRAAGAGPSMRRLRRLSGEKG